MTKPNLLPVPAPPGGFDSVCQLLRTLEKTSGQHKAETEQLAHELTRQVIRYEIECTKLRLRHIQAHLKALE